MAAGLAEALMLVGLLEAKHALADYGLTNRYMMENRRTYGHPGGLLHVAVHLGCTAVALLLFAGLSGLAVPLSTVALILAVEGVFHYHLDWGKDTLVHRAGLTPRDAGFWRLAGADQLLHHLSYLAFAAWALSAVAA